MAKPSTGEYLHVSGSVDGGVIWNLAIRPPDISEETRLANQHLSAHFLCTGLAALGMLNC